jgi:hypothetical protein
LGKEAIDEIYVEFTLRGLKGREFHGKGILDKQRKEVLGLRTKGR